MKQIDDDRAFDLLVDGELSEQQQRELLAGLDDLPGGWRRCALAFLEAQCWKQGLQSVARRRAPQPTAAGPRRRFRLTGPLGTVLAMAVTFLVALGLGVSWRGTKLPGSSSRVEPRRPPAASEAKEEPVIRPRQPQRPETPLAPMRVVTVDLGQGPDGARESIPLPAFQSDEIDEDWLRRGPPPIPNDVRQMLEGTGHRVRQSRQMLWFPLADGHRLLVPVDHFDVRYVGNRAYQ